LAPEYKDPETGNALNSRQQEALKARERSQQKKLPRKEKFDDDKWRLLMLESISHKELQLWMSTHSLRYDEQDLDYRFAEVDETAFRIPIGDYLLQLDYRISAILDLLPDQEPIIVFPRSLKWDFSDNRSPLGAVLRSFIPLDSIAVRALPGERKLVFATTYMTNRWGRSSNSIYIASESSPRLLVYAPGSPESVFVMSHDLEIHDASVTTLNKRGIPAYGRYIVHPIPEPIYKDIEINGLKVGVDQLTGKPIGIGSNESILLPEYLPPS
jgi:hypothetical protein